MSENGDQDKTEKASPYKLEQARKKGQVAKSMEVNSLVTLTTFTLLGMGLFPYISEAIALLFRQFFISSGSIQINTNSAIDFFLEPVFIIFTIFSPMIVAIILLGVGVTMMQTKPVFSTEPLKPNFSKLNPVSGFKKLFSMKAVFELIKTVLKLCAIGAFFYFGLNAIMEELLASKYLSPNHVNEYWFDNFKVAALWLVVILVPFALFDLIFTKKEFSKKMRMSKREVKEEHKRRDGDPEIKAKRKKIQNELSKRTSSISNVKDADVILTNPTHYAVALKYTPHEMIAPIVIAKGSDLFADKIKRIALEHNVPIFRQPTLARKIFKETEIDQAILESNYLEIAPVFRWVFEFKGKM